MQVSLLKNVSLIITLFYWINARAKRRFNHYVKSSDLWDANIPNRKCDISILTVFAPEPARFY